MKQRFTTVLLLLLLSSCSTYKMDVQQGNVLSNDEVSQLRQGMTKAEVAALLGTPLLQDNFRNNRWDYVYFVRAKNGDPALQQNLTLQFQNEQLVQVSN